MTSNQDMSQTIDSLESRWQTVSEKLRYPGKILKPLNAALLLRNLSISIFDLEKANKANPERHYAGENLQKASEQDVIANWERLKQYPILQNDAKALKALVKDSLYQGIRPILEDSFFLELLKQQANFFFTPLWLRRYYFFYFDTLYLSEEKNLARATEQLLGQCFCHLKHDGSLYRNGEVKVRYASLVKTLNITTQETVGLDPAKFEEYMATLLHLAPPEAMQTISSLEQYFRHALGFDLLPGGIRRYCQKHLFHIVLSKYLKDINDTVSLNNLLDQFCPLDTSFGQEHLVRLVTEAYGGPNKLKNLPAPLKSCIQNFLHKTIQDPRLNTAPWLSLKARHRQLYDSLRYWFVEADFNLFFDFAFRHSRDDHRRKDLWSLYLKQAHDFRVFLPPDSYRDFHSQEKDKSKHTQVYKNHELITGFIMCIENLVIYEAVETGNAAYIYDLEELRVKETPEAKRVSRYLTHLLEKNSLPGYTGTRSALAHVNLAPLPNDSYGSPIRSRRFTHDRNLQWHDQVIDYLRRHYLIVPDRPE